MINIWFKFEDKIQNTSKVIVFTRNHTDDDGTKNNVSPPVGGGGERHNYINLFVRNMYITEATFISQLHSAI